jgi:hypothetical protein
VWPLWTPHTADTRPPEELEEGYWWIYERLFSHASIWRRVIAPYLAMSYLYKRSNRFWHRLIKHHMVHAVGRPLVELTRVRHLRFRQGLAEAETPTAPGKRGDSGRLNCRQVSPRGRRTCADSEALVPASDFCDIETEDGMIDSVTEKESGVHYLTDDEALAIFENAARYYLNMSGEEFLQAWNEGRFRDRACTDSGVAWVSTLIPLVEPR